MELSRANLTGYLSTNTIESFSERSSSNPYLTSTGPLGRAGPLGSMGPLSDIGGIGTSLFHPSQWFKLINSTTSCSSVLSPSASSKTFGPLSEYGPLGESGPLGKAYLSYFNAVKNSLTSESELFPGGSLQILGPVGHLGPLGLLGPLGPIGAHGLTTNALGQYLGKDGSITQSLKVSYSKKENRNYSLFEYYPNLSEVLKSVPYLDTSFASDGALAEDLPTIEIPIHSKQNELISISAIPLGLDAFDLVLLDANKKVIETVHPEDSHYLSHLVVETDGSTDFYIQIRNRNPNARYFSPARFRIVVSSSSKYYSKRLVHGPLWKEL